VMLRNFTYAMNLVITAGLALCLVPPVFDFVTRGLMGLPEEVAAITHRAGVMLLPWPAAIGYRRFYQGLLIRRGQTRRVGYGTAIRVAGMAVTALLLAVGGRVDGAAVGTAALAAGVTIEALASRLMAAPIVRRLKREETPATHGPAHARALTYREIWVFYYPLALTSMINMGLNPLATFFLGRSRMALESLAVMPVVYGLSFLFGSGGLAYQEAAIALLGPHREGYRPLRRFALWLGVSCSAGLAVIAFTPLATVWLVNVSGLTPDLARVALWPIRVMSAMPFLTVLMCFQRGMLVAARRTHTVTLGTAVEVGGVLLLLIGGVEGLSMVGATAAGCSYVLGRLASVLYQRGPVHEASLPPVTGEGAAGPLDKSGS
jgi:progressive ankylosis protein